MKIGIDARIINDYVKYLIKSLLRYDKHDQYILFFDSRVSHKDAHKIAGKHKNVKIKYFPFSRYRRFIRYAYSQILVSVFLKKQHLDLLHATAGTMPIIYRGKKILNLWRIETKFRGRVLQKNIAKSASNIIVPSNSLKKELVTSYKIKPERIIVLKEKPSAVEILRIYMAQKEKKRVKPASQI